LLDPRALRTFLAVCREATISGGARALNISQPSVSNSIAQLEHAVGASLFDRARSGIVLTPIGHALRRRAEAMDMLLRDTTEEMALALDGIKGPLRIGGTPGALVSLLPEALKTLEAQYGRFTVHVVERPDQDLIGMLRKGDIELAMVTTGIDALPEDIDEIPLARDPFALIVGEDNTHLPEHISLREVAELRWVLPEAQGSFRRQVDALFLQADQPSPRDVIRCDSLLTTKAIVRGSERITILPEKVAEAEISIGVLRAIRIKEAGFERSIGIRKLRGANLSQLGSALVDILSINP
jgi:LysR family transcriptional regulator, regulator of abg operon